MKPTATKILIGTLANLLLCFNAFAVSDALKIKIISGSYSDETVIRFLPSATPAFDGSYDAYKLFSASAVSPAMFTRLDSVTAMSINALPLFSGQTNIKVYTHIKVAGTYTLQSIELGTGFQGGTEITLEDLQTGALYSFKNGQSVTLAMAVNTVNSPNRFVIHFSPSMIITSSDASSHGHNDGSIYLSKPGNANWNYILKDVYGVTVSSSSSINDNILISGLYAGDYTVYTSGYGCLPDSAFVIVGQASLLPIDASFWNSNDTVTAGRSGILFSNTSTGASFYSWDFGDGSISDSISPFHQYYTAGTFMVNLVAADSFGRNSSYSKVIVVTADLSTGILNADNQSSLLVYENEGALQIRIASDRASGIIVHVFNAFGQLAGSFKADNSNSLSESLALSSSGVYTVQAMIGNKVESKKISYIK
jgi:PKD repeat protein